VPDFREAVSQLRIRQDQGSSPGPLLLLQAGNESHFSGSALVSLIHGNSNHRASGKSICESGPETDIMVHVAAVSIYNAAYLAAGLFQSAARCGAAA
jgi:hypothetical protein